MRTARELIALNNRFYAEHAASFSATRNAPWPGWSRLADELRDCGWSAAESVQRTVLDLACGNLRFERFLAREFPEIVLRFEAVDSCPELFGNLDVPNVTFRQLDILGEMLDGQDVALGRERPCNLSVCFGFMHHVPGAELRQRVLDALIDATAPKGIIAVSFWQFLNDDRLAAKAAQARAIADEHPPFAGYDADELDARDQFLGWQNDERPLRYCHHFDEDEIDCLVTDASSRVRELSRWSADGRSGTLNRYLLLQRR